MITLGCDVSDIILQRTLQYNADGLTQTINQMSTGYKLNNAKDNAAGYSIAKDLSVKISSMLQVQQNTEDGIAMLQTAEGGLEEITNLLQRLRSLAMQASNGNYGADSRASMQAEADEIIEEIERIRHTIEYNGMNLYETPQNDTVTTGNVVTTAINNLQRARVSINGETVSQTLNSSASNLVAPSTLSTLSNYSSDEQSAPLSEALTASTFTPGVSTLAAGDIEGAVDFNGSESKTVNIDGVDYTITNRLTTSQSISYIKDTSTGELTFLGSNFDIRGQKDVAHNIIISGSNNHIYGGNLNDKLSDSAGSRTNTYYGGAGDDIFSITTGYNTVYGEAGDDTFSVNGGSVTIYGGEGNDNFDLIYAGGTISGYGGAGDDVFTVHRTNSYSAIKLNGEDGEDSFNIISGYNVTVDGGAGTNSVTDNGTNTTLINVPGANSFSVTFRNGETKILTINGIDYEVKNGSGAVGYFVYSIDYSTGQITLSPPNSGWTIKGDENKAHNVLLSGNGRNYFYGGNLSDTIVAEKKDWVIYSLDGDDAVTISAYSEVHAGDGNNTITITSNYNYVSSGNGNTTVTFQGNTVHNYVDLGNGRNTIDIQGSFKYGGLYGGSGSNNTLIGNVSDSLICGFGEDIDNAEVLVVSSYSSQDLLIDGKNYNVNNASSFDHSILYSSNPVTGTISFSAYQLTVEAQKDVEHNVHLYGQGIKFRGGDLEDTIVTDCRAVGVSGNGGNDNIIVNNGGDNTIHGGDGDDNIIINAGGNIHGDAGDDTITNNNANTSYNINGGDGNDTYNINNSANITDTGGDNIYNVNTNNANISGASGNDTFYINGNNNTILGGGGDDYFVIDGDNNMADGGTGNNYYVNNGSGTSFSNVVRDPNSGGLSFTYQGEVKTFTLNGKTYTVTNNISGSNMLQYSLNPNTGVITLNGSNFQIDAEKNESAILNIRGDNNTVNGSDLNDRITVEQGSGNVVNGGAGNDTLIMNSDNNSINGGDGSDTITLNSSTNQSVSGGDGDDTLTINSDNNTNIDLGSGNDRITVSGDSNRITANDGNNTITINSDSNTISAGNGDNRFVINGSTNTVTAGSGDNILGIQGNNNNVTAQNASGDINIYGDNNTLTNIRGENTVTIRGDGNSYTTMVGDKEVNVVGDNNNVLTGSGDDAITIRGNDNILESTSGNNELTVRGDGNSIQGGSGIDDISINGDNNTANGGDSSDSFMISSGNNNTIDGEQGDRDTMINNGNNTTFSNVVDITPRPFEVKIKVDIGSGANKYITGEISFNLFDFSVDFSTTEGAQEALSTIDDLIKTVEEQLLNIGTLINRLESAAESQSIKLENLISSQSTIRDADIAEVSSDLVRYQILQSASATLMSSSRSLKAQNVLGLLSSL